MNRYFTSLLVVMVLAIGLIWYSFRDTPLFSFLGETPTSTPPAASSTGPYHTAASPSPTSKNSAFKPQTYKSIITQTGNHQCDYQEIGSVGRTTGVVYIADGKMRAELRTTVEDTTTNTLAVYDGRYLYTWKEGMSVGTKTQPSSVSQLPLIIPKDLSSNSVLGSGTDSVSWHCHYWLKNPALLVPPAYVTFK